MARSRLSGRLPADLLPAQRHPRIRSRAQVLLQGPRVSVVGLSSPSVPVSVHKVHVGRLQDSRLPVAVVPRDGAESEDRAEETHGGEEDDVLG
eukprot:749791-Hanusia_phi.AAC.1